MGNLFGRALNKYRNEQVSTLNNPSPWLLKNLGVDGEGVNVDERTSLALSSFYGGVNIIANHIASLPIDVVQRSEEGNTVDADHHLNEILKYQSSRYLSATHFKKLLTVNTLVYGNGFARIERGGNEVVSLQIEKPKDVDIYKNKESGDIFYKFKNIDKKYPARDVIHVYDFTLDGYKGLSVLEAGAKESFEGHMSVQKFSKKYFDNNAHIGGVLSTEDSLGTDEAVVNEAKSEIRKEFEHVYSGEQNWFRTAILEGTWDYQALDIKASDAMLIERSQATVEDVSRWLQMPLSFLNHTDSQSFKSKEQESRTYVNNCLNPKIRIIENEIRNKLFLETEKQAGYKVNIDTKQLVRASLKDTGEFLSQMVDRSIFSLNESRDFLDMDSKDGLDIHLQQLNMKELGSDPEE
jgi:HK97 family phage portal protein